MRGCRGARRDLPTQTARHDSQPAFVLIKRGKAMSKTAAQAAVGGLGIRNRHGPDYEVVLATIEHAVYNGRV
jgi:hypothetical protein